MVCRWHKVCTAKQGPVTTCPTVLPCFPRPKCSPCSHIITGRYFYPCPSYWGLFPCCWSVTRVPQQPQSKRPFGLGSHITSLQKPCHSQEASLNASQVEDVGLQNMDPVEPLWDVLEQEVGKEINKKQGFGSCQFPSPCARLKTTNRALADGICTSAVHITQSWQQLALQTQDLSLWYVIGRGKWRHPINCSHGEIGNTRQQDLYTQQGWSWRKM